MLGMCADCLQTLIGNRTEGIADKMSAEHHTENIRNEIFLARDQVTVYMPCHADAKKCGNSTDCTV